MTDAHLVKISDAPLMVAEVLAAVSGATVGGTTIFVGAVRDHDDGNEVAALSYSAHPGALETLRSVVADVAAAHPKANLAAVHRVGDLAIGDLAVVVGAGCAHRDEAFAAARDLIEQIKAQVPIWKHQRFADGSEEWVGLP